MGRPRREQKLGMGHKLGSLEWHKSLLADPTFLSPSWIHRQRDGVALDLGRGRASKKTPAPLVGQETGATDLLCSGCDNHTFPPSLLPRLAGKSLLYPARRNVWDIRMFGMGSRIRNRREDFRTSRVLWDVSDSKGAQQLLVEFHTHTNK